MTSGWDRRRRVRMNEYELVALGLFADRGFRNVTVDDIAEAAGVSARTLFRYFPTKEEFLLAYPRRGVEALVDAIAEFEPSADPLETAWRELITITTVGAPERDSMMLWRRAALDAPEVVDRVRGERVQALIDALTDYCAKSLDADPAVDVRPRLLAGLIAGGELAVVEAMSRSEMNPQQIFDEVIGRFRLAERPKKPALATRARRR